MKIIITEQQFKQLINEAFISDMDTFWAWVSPENEFFKVPILRHKDFIMNKYKDAGPWAWDYDRVFDKALLDGWVRVIYEYNKSNFKGDLSVNGYHKDRVVNVVKTVFKDLLKYGYKSVYIDIEEPKESMRFSTFDSAGKFKLQQFLNEDTFQANMASQFINTTHQLGWMAEEEQADKLPLEQLKQKYPPIKFTLDPNPKFKDSYFARADIKTQGGEMEYLGALKGPVSYEDGLEFLNNVAKNNYDKYY